mgnify:CR=1 FL=1
MVQGGEGRHRTAANARNCAARNTASCPIVVEVEGRKTITRRGWPSRSKQSAAAADDPNKVWTEADLAAEGEKIFAANCAACHQANGKGVPNAFPALDGSQIVNGPAEAQIDLVLHGKANTAMPSWKQLSNTDIAAVITYTRNAWSNRSGQAIQPSAILAARGK